MIPDALRSQARAAIERAWAAAIESGALPELPGDAERPAIEVEHPADPKHGDLATNLAMKLARPYRQAPLQIATVLAAKLVRDAAAEGSTSPIESAEVAPPGFINLRFSEAALARTVDAHPRRARRLGPRPRRLATDGERRIRVGQSDRSADHRQRARCVHRRPAQSRPRGRWPARHPRVLLQRLRGPDRQPGCVGRGHPPGRAGPGGGLPGRLRLGPRGGRPGRRLGGGHRPTGQRRPTSWAAGRPAGCAP